MYFTIDAAEYILGLKGSYRLKKDESWEEQKHFIDFDLEDDMLFKSYKDAEGWLQANPAVNIKGKQISTKEPEVVTLGEKNISFEIILHRVSKPRHLITKEEIAVTLQNGNDDYNNSLVIDLDGYPRLIQVKGFTPLMIRGYAICYETFGAGNGYVGSNKMPHLNEVYLTLLEAWLLHLQSGRSIYRDYCSGQKSEKRLLNEIQKEIFKLK